MISTIMKPWNLLSLVIFAFRYFSRNCLVVVHEPLGDTYVCTHFLGFLHKPPGGSSSTYDVVVMIKCLNVNFTHMIDCVYHDYVGRHDFDLKLGVGFMLGVKNNCA